MPFTDEQFVLQYVASSNFNRATYKAMVCMPDGSVCGRRKVDEEVYDPDVLCYEDDGSTWPSTYFPSNQGNSRIEVGYLGFEIIDPDGPIQEFYFNDYEPIRVDRPPAFQVQVPEQNSQLSLSEQSAPIRLEWSPADKSIPISWKLLALDNEAEEKPCDLLSWGAFEGQGEDMGFLDIPLDIFPSDLPPEGCDMSISLRRTKFFDLPAGIQNGFIQSSRVDGILFKILP